MFWDGKKHLQEMIQFDDILFFKMGWNSTTNYSPEI